VVRSRCQRGRGMDPGVAPRTRQASRRRRRLHRYLGAGYRIGQWPGPVLV